MLTAPATVLDCSSCPGSPNPFSASLSFNQHGALLKQPDPSKKLKKIRSTVSH